MPAAELSQEPDEALVAAARGGDDDAFGELVRRYQRRMFRIAMGYLREAAEADNIVQDAFVAAWQRLAAFKGESSFETWITRIAINRCLDRLKSREWKLLRRLWRPSQEDPEAGTSFWDTWRSGSPSPEDEVLGRESMALVGRALEALSPQQRMVFLLRHQEEMSLAEIAAAMDVDVGTVKTHLFRAVHRVRDAVRRSHEHRR